MPSANTVASTNTIIIVHSALVKTTHVTVSSLCLSSLLPLSSSLPFEPSHFGSSFGVRGCGRRQEVEWWGGTHRDRASDQDGALGSNVRPGAVGYICFQHVLSTPPFRVNPRRGSTRLPEKRARAPKIVEACSLVLCWHHTMVLRGGVAGS